MKKFLRKRFLAFMIVSFTFMFLIVYFSLTYMVFRETDQFFNREARKIQTAYQTELLELEQSETKMRNSLLEKARVFARAISASPEKMNDHEWILQMGKVLEVNSLCVSDGDGVLISATDEGFIGFRMDSSEQSKAFMPACSDKSFELAQKPMERGIDRISCQYAGVARIDKPGIVQVGKEYPDGVTNAILILQKILQTHELDQEGSISVVEEEDWNADTRVLASSFASINGKTMAYLGITKSFLPNRVETAGVPYYCKVISKIKIDDKEYPVIACLNLNEMLRGRNHEILVVFSSFLFLMVLLYFILMRFLQKNVIDAIYRINEGMEQVIAGNLHVTIRERHLPEFTTLTDAINTTVGELQRRNRKFKKQIGGEREITSSILNTINDLREPFYPDVDNIDFSAVFEQTGENGAACVQLLAYEDGSPLFILADSTGSGVAACLYMMKFRATLLNCADNGFLPPLPELLRRLRAAMIAEPGLAKLFMSVFFGHFIPETRTLEYVNAGYVSPMIKRVENNSVERLPAGTKNVLSSKADAADRLQTIMLNPGDLFFAFSEGLMLASNSSNELFSIAKIEQILADSPQDSSARTVLDSMRDEYGKFIDGRKSENDIIMLCMKIR